MHHEDAVQLLEQLRALQSSWIWHQHIVPYFDGRVETLVAAAQRPVPDDTGHTEARYRLAEIADFKAFLQNLETNATLAAREPMGEGGQ